MQSTQQKRPEASASFTAAIRQLVSADIPELAALAGHIWRITYPDTLSHDEIETAITRGYSSEALTKSMQGAYAMYGAFDNNRMIGFTGIEMKTDGSMFIHKLYVHPDAQGGGIGRKLLDHVLGTHSPNAARLNTNRRNVKAINFYFSQGFIIERLDPHDSGVGFFADDFLLVRRSI